MNHFIVILFSISLVGSVFGADINYPTKVKLYVESYGKQFSPDDVRLVDGVYLVKWPVGVPPAAEADLTDDATLSIDPSYRKMVGHKYVPMSIAEVDEARTSIETATLTNNVQLISLLEAINEKHGGPGKDISITNLVEKIKAKKVK